MHKFKAKASRLAAYPDEDGTGQYNPFGKFRPSSKEPNGDPELGRTHSETSASKRPEKAPRHGGGDDVGPLPSAATMPAKRSAEAESDGIASSSSETDGHARAPDTPVGDAKIGASETVNSAQSDNAPRQRKGFMDKLHLKRNRDAAAQQPDESKNRPRQNFTVASQLRLTIFNSWINLLLIAIPVGVALGFIPGMNPLAVFVVNFIAIIPLAAMLSFATEEIALHVGETLGGLLNATFGNAVELIVSIIALFKDEIVIVQTSLIGSMLSNLLLVLGMCFIFGGWNRVEQHFNMTVAQTAASLLALATASLIIPTAFNKWADRDGTSDDATLITDVREISRGTSVLLLLVYACYLFFQLHTHIDMYNAPSEKVPKRREGNKDKGEARKSIVAIGGVITAGGANADAHEKAQAGETEEREQPQLSASVGLFTLVWSTALVGLCAELLVDSIEKVVTQYHVSETFVGLVLLPIVGNAAEHATSVTVACKDKMDLAIGVAVGSSMQIALLVLPLVVVIGWIAGKNDMTLDFNSFEIVILFVSVLLVNYLIGDGKSHWLEGVLLSTLYLIIALAAWFFPPVERPSGTVPGGGD